MWASRMGPDGRILPAPKTNQIAGFVKNTARSRIEKKNNALTIALFYYMIAKTTIHPSTVSVATDGYLPRLFFTARQISTSSHSHLGAGE